ncbi:MAG: VPLPA-CTERM sorting domain-containing protein, partial [Gammaproteobacteria bacterium]
LAMFDVDDFDGAKANPLLIDNGSDGTGVGEGFDTVPITAAGSDYTATSTESTNSITLFNDPQFVIALTDNGGNWYEPTSWFEVAENIYDVMFDNGEVLTIDAVPTVVETAVPLPAAVWLFGSGLLGLVGIARRKRMS